MLITIDSHDERVTIATATSYPAPPISPGGAGAAGGALASGPAPADLDAGPAGLNPAAFGPAGNGSAVATAGGGLDGGAYTG